VVLYPSDDAVVLDKRFAQADPRPVTLVVPDGNWRQASRIPQRVPGLVHAPRVVLPSGPPSAWGIRTETRDGGLATFEAIARALGVLENPELQEQLELLFQHLVRGTRAARSDSKPAGKVTAAMDDVTRAVEPLRALFQDDDLVAISKPPGMLVHRGWARDGVPALQALRDQIGRYVFPVHRLDRGTSGVLVFALRSEVARDLQQQFVRGEVDKRYLALCRGKSPELRRVDHPIAAVTGDEPRPAVTNLCLLGSFERYGLYEARPQTGRTHQIRRHLKHASHPIIGDVRYGKGEQNRVFRERFGFHRMALHCTQLGFEHPRSGEAMTVVAPVEDAFARLLDELGLTRTER
jgi:tRNA pseudouridine65 synthase